MQDLDEQYNPQRAVLWLADGSYKYLSDANFTQLAYVTLYSEPTILDEK